jgi:hypothetical protein
MIFTICFAMLLAKIKGYKASYLFKTWTIYPALLIDLAYVYFQVNIFIGNYNVVLYASIIRYSFLLSFLIPMFVYQLYKPAIIGSCSILVGSALNNFVMSQNARLIGGKIVKQMPVYPSLSYITGYVKAEAFLIVKDVHVLGNANTHWKILTDYIDVGFSILSIGDLFIHFYVFIMVYYLIKALNKKNNSQ